MAESTTMAVSVSTLVKDVRILLDMNNSSDALISVDDIDALSMEQIIERNVVAGVRMIESAAPGYMVLGDATLKGEDVTFGTKSKGLYTGVVALPDDYMRLLSFKMSDWERPGKIISEDDMEYALQSSKWPGLKGNPEAPIAALVQAEGTGTSKMNLEIYSCYSDEATIEKGVYLKEPSVVTEGTEQTINVCPKLVEAVKYAIASMVADTYQSAALSATLLQQAYKLAEIQTVQVENNTNDTNNG